MSRHLLRRTGSSLALGLLVALPVFAQVEIQPRMGDPVPGLTTDELARFALGRTAFQRALVVDDGLGPIFNQTSCGSCHNTPTSGGSGTISVTRFGLVEPGVPFDPLVALGGSLLQSQAIDDACLETLPPEANVTTLRITPPLFGAGLVEAIDDADLLAGTSGLAHWVAPLEDPLGPLRVGRFGWKAQVATVLSFSGDAARNEMGLTNRLVPTENAPNGDVAALATCDTLADPEDGPDDEGYDFVDRVTDFQRFLAPPPQTPRSGMTGEIIFQAMGCAECHVTTGYTTGTVGVAALSGVMIHPYSDFRLHDMGVLGDGITQGDAIGQEFRTTPLWGLRARNQLLHDGRVAGGTFASRIEEVVEWHDGEAALSATNYFASSIEDRQQVIRFFASLGRREFDANGDGTVDHFDYSSLRGCVEAASVITPDDPCAVSDIDADGDLDSTDFEAFLLAYDDPVEDCDLDGTPDLLAILQGAENDCNDNARPDSCDIDSGASTDLNENGVPDECESFLENLIWCAELSTGDTDSCSVLMSALASFGHDSVAIVDPDDPLVDAAGPNTVLWVILGTYPSNHQLSEGEGARLAELAAMGVAIYIESNDAWGFDPPTVFEQYDGVEGSTVEDGDDSLTGLIGQTGAPIELSDFGGVAYVQDQVESDWSDQIFPTGTTPGAPVDLGGDTAWLLWTNDPGSGETAYPVGVLYHPDGYGRVIAQSWEIGGFDGDVGVIADLYRQALVDAPTTPQFVRADCNGDGEVDIADAIFVLVFLFGVGDTPGCADACDTNDDGQLNVADAIYTLAHLFSAGPPPPAPFATCGEDPTSDPLECESACP